MFSAGGNVLIGVGVAIAPAGVFALTVAEGVGAKGVDRGVLVIGWGASEFGLPVHRTLLKRISPKAATKMISVADRASIPVRPVLTRRAGIGGIGGMAGLFLPALGAIGICFPRDEILLAEPAGVGTKMREDVGPVDGLVVGNAGMVCVESRSP
jgi:hypothetical protein